MKHNEKIIVMLSRLAARRVSASQHLNKAEALNKDTFRATRRVGFTLIELLVVVLIIGILSAIALPQYTLAVEKARMAEALQNVNSLQRAIDVYLLENGGFPSKNVEFVGDSANIFLDIDFTGLDCSSWYQHCCSKSFCYQASCSKGGGCQAGAIRMANGNSDEEEQYELYFVQGNYDDPNIWKWYKYFLYSPNFPYTQKIAAMLEKQGYEVEGSLY